MDDPQRLPGEDSGDSESLRVAREEAWGDAHSLLSAPQHVGPDRPYSTGFRTNHDSISAVRARENEDRMDRVPPLTAPPPDELVVLTPTRVRVDSRVVFVHCTSNWLSNCFLAVLILCKVCPCMPLVWLLSIPCASHTIKAR